MKLCPSCQLPLVIGLCLDNSTSSLERIPITGSPIQSNGTLEKCFKCPLCGYSETETEMGNNLLPISEWSELELVSFEEFCEWGKRNCK
jgi:hypothetical protein